MDTDPNPLTAALTAGAPGDGHDAELPPHVLRFRQQRLLSGGGAGAMPQQTSADAKPLAVALTDGAARADGGSSVRPQKTLGEKVSVLGLIAPTLLNWAVLAWARWFGKPVEFEDSEGVMHATHRFRNDNFDHIFFVASMACISGFSAHIWLTATAIARRHALDHVGAHGGVGYAARLAAAEAETRQLSKAEWAHVGLVAFDFFFAAFFVFMPAYGWSGAVSIGLSPGVSVALTAPSLGPARVAVLRKQRTSSVTFAGAALRGSLAALTAAAIVLARCVPIPRPPRCALLRRFVVASSEH